MEFSHHSAKPDKTSVASCSELESLLRQVISKFKSHLTGFSTTSGTSWYLDSACCNHMTNDPSTFITTMENPCLPNIQTADGSTMNVTQIGTVSTEAFSLPNTYFVPNLTLNLVSIGQLCDLGLDIIFSSSGCHIQDPQTNKIIGTGRRCGRLFELTSLHLPTPKLSSSHLVGSVSSTTSIWHSRLLNLAENTNGSSTLASQRAPCHISNLSFGRFNENKSGCYSLRTAASGRFRGRDDEKITQSSDSKSANQDEIISLFRRIQSSISKEETMTKKQSSGSDEEKPSPESILDVLQQSSKQMKVANTLNERGEKVLSIRKGHWKNDGKTDFPSVPDLKLTRPPSNFIKRSPIPSAPSSRQKTEDNREPLDAGSEKEFILERIEVMKLPALKELAKSRGLKGYSKLKKSELIELLRS